MSLAIYHLPVKLSPPIICQNNMRGKKQKCVSSLIEPKAMLSPLTCGPLVVSMHIQLSLSTTSPIHLKLQYHLLETCEFIENHTAEKIAQETKDILKDWKLSPQHIVAATTDNGANVSLAIEMMECLCFPCFSHTLQLAVEALKLPDVSMAVGRCKRVVVHFNHSSKSSYLLEQKQIDLHHTQLSLVQDVPA